jgi:hypothetical protein
MRDWAAACRAIDRHFASTEDRARILAREPAAPVPPDLAPPDRVRAHGNRRALDLFS